MSDDRLHILLISVHGLIRGSNPELGRDPDTGGQVLYVLELARNLARHPGVAQVDLLTRKVRDRGLGQEYDEPVEPLGPGVRILRLPFGPAKYLRKELLWDHLDELVDAYLSLARTFPRLPDIIHSHYGDAGYVALRLANLLGIPFIHTGHSLGRCKKAALLAAGGREPALERQFHFSRRIHAEEEVLAQAAMVIASTRQEVQEQYGGYLAFDARRAAVLPPGTDLSRFTPPGRHGRQPAVAAKVDRFLRDPEKPMLVCVGRPAPRKNLLGLVRAFGQDAELRRMANLVIIGGNREDLRDLPEPARQVWGELLEAIDRHDLYGHVAIPKNHVPEDIPDLYRLAVLRRGLCINPSFSETFGLTLIEAGACGLPLVATASGGPKDILATCRNGLTMNAQDPADMAKAIKEALGDLRQWRQWSRNGIRRVRSEYTWEAHVERYLGKVRRIVARARKRTRRSAARLHAPGRHPLLHAEGAVVLDLDRTLVGDRDSLAELLPVIHRLRCRLAFGIATGRRIEGALRVLADWGIETPDFLVSSVGSELHYGPDWTKDDSWEAHIRWKWQREPLVRVLAAVAGLKPQAPSKCGPFKVSFHVSPRRFPGLAAVEAILHREGLSAHLVYSQGRYLDAIPIRASKGQAVRHLALRWGLPFEGITAAGDSGNDLDLLSGIPHGIVVGNHSPELEVLRNRSGVHFAVRGFAAGVLEGLKHFGLVGPPEPSPTGPAGTPGEGAYP